MSEFVSLQVVTLKKPHVTHGTSEWLHPYTHTEHKIMSYSINNIRENSPNELCGRHKKNT